MGHSKAAPRFAKAVALHRQGDGSGAARLYEQVLKVEPGHVPARYNLALALLENDRIAPALAHLDHILARHPAEPGALYTKGRALAHLGRGDEALDVLARAAAADPGNAEVLLVTANIHGGAGRLGLAEADLRRALAMRPGYVDALINLGRTLSELGRFAAAEEAIRAALARAPGHPAALNNLGNLLKLGGRSEDAIAAFERVLAAWPEFAEAHHNLGLLKLAHGRFAEGWRELEWRWRLPNVADYGQRAFPSPAWDGRPLAAGKKLLLWGEQGVGDEILGLGMAADAARLGGGCVIECDPRLVPLFARSAPDMDFIARRTPADPRTAAADIGANCPLVSLGRFCRTGFDQFPRAPYLTADGALAERLRRRYRGAGGGPVIGLSWRSKRPSVAGALKSSQILEWAPVLTLPGVTFVNLQYGDCSADLEQARRELGVTIVQDPDIDPMTDLDGFAAQVAAMDLVVSTSNTTVHVAGALGVPVWNLLPRGPGLMWYWFVGREDSPWYGSMRLLRQDEAGDWTSLLGRVAQEVGARFS